MYLGLYKIHTLSTRYNNLPFVHCTAYSSSHAIVMHCPARCDGNHGQIQRRALCAKCIHPLKPIKASVSDLICLSFIQRLASRLFAHTRASSLVFSRSPQLVSPPSPATVGRLTHAYYSATAPEQWRLFCNASWKTQFCGCLPHIYANSPISMGRKGPHQLFH